MMMINAKATTALENKDNIGSLPSELQLKIFGYLNMIDLARCSCVCVGWRSVILKMRERGTLDFTDVGHKMNDDTFVKMTSRRRCKLLKLILPKMYLLTNRAYQHIATLKNLQEILLPRCFELTDIAVQNILTNCCNVVALDVSFTRITDTSIRAMASQGKNIQSLKIQGCVNLTYQISEAFGGKNAFRNLLLLDISHCHQLYSKTIASIATGCPTIKHWYLNGLPYLDDAALKAVGNNCKRIVTLSVANSGNNQQPTIPPPRSHTDGANSKPKSSTHMPHGGVNFIQLNKARLSGKATSPVPHFTSPTQQMTRSVSMHGARLKIATSAEQRKDLEPTTFAISDSGLSTVCQLGSKRIVITDMPAITAASFKPLAGVKQHSAHAQLECFRVTNCPNLSDYALRHLSHQHRIRVLDLSNCTKLTDTAVNLIAEGSYHTTLRELYLRGCNRLTDTAVLSVGKRMPRMSYLSFAQCELISDAAFDLLPNCHHLKTLDTTGTKLGDRGLLAIGNIVNLRDGNFSNCCAITDMGLQKFSHSAKNIERLDLSFCYNITDGAIKTLAFCARYIVQLNLAGCYQLSDVSIQCLSGVCQYLVKLDISGCINLTEAALIYLKKGCPNLKLLIMLYCKLLTKRSVVRLTKQIEKVDFSCDPPPPGFLKTPPEETTDQTTAPQKVR